MGTTILQISDPHLMSQTDGRMHGIRPYDTLRSVLGAARSIHGTPEHVVFSGDLSQEHTEMGYRQLANVLHDWIECSSFVPGNHDDRQELINVFPQPKSNATCVTFRLTAGEWQIIGLDSHSPGNVFGELSSPQLEILENWIAKDRSRPTLLFLHHPPISVESPCLDPLVLQNGTDLAEAISGTGVRGIFCGHVHHEYEGDLAGVPVYTTPSTAFQFKPHTDRPAMDPQPPGWRSIMLEEDIFTTNVHRLDTIDDIPTLAT